MGLARQSKITANSRDDKRADDLVNRNFNAHRPNQLWVADFTYIKTTSGWVYTAFIIDVLARAIVGWKVSNRMNTDMVMVALNQAIADRNNPKDVTHHSDRGVQYLSIGYTDKMKDSGVIASVARLATHTTMPWLRRSMDFISLRSFIIWKRAGQALTMLNWQPLNG